MNISEYTDFAQILATFFAAFGLLLTAYQISRSVKERRIDRVDRVRQAIFGDHDVSEIYYLLEYGKFTYNDDFHGSDTEKKMDKLLCLFDTLAKQVNMGLLKLEDIDLLAYEYLVIYQNEDVQSYLKFLDSWLDVKGMKRPQFEAFRQVGKRLENNNG